MNGAPLEETNLTGGWLRDYIFFNGQRIAARTPTAGLLGFFANHLGSTSKLESVSSSGTVTLDYDADYYPFGRAHQFVDSYDPAFKFTGKERDPETGLDNFGARYYASTMGRFVSADWSAKAEAVPYGKLNNPESLNLYTYVLDNPSTSIDPNGHSTLVFNGATHRITLIAKSGAVVGSWTAHNNVAIHNRVGGRMQLTSGPMTNGLHPIEQRDQHGATMHLGGSPNGPYGRGGIVHVTPYTGILGNKVTGSGIHAGRASHGGSSALTLACVRTCGSAMSTINQTAKSDPLTSLLVTNNGQNISQWLNRAGQQGMASGTLPTSPPIGTTLIQPRRPQPTLVNPDGGD